MFSEAAVAIRASAIDTHRAHQPRTVERAEGAGVAAGGRASMVLNNRGDSPMSRPLGLTANYIARADAIATATATPEAPLAQNASAGADSANQTRSLPRMSAQPIPPTIAREKAREGSMSDVTDPICRFDAGDAGAHGQLFAAGDCELRKLIRSRPRGGILHADFDTTVFSASRFWASDLQPLRQDRALEVDCCKSGA